MSDRYAGQTPFAILNKGVSEWYEWTWVTKGTEIHKRLVEVYSPRDIVTIDCNALPIRPTAVTLFEGTSTSFCH